MTSSVFVAGFAGGVFFKSKAPDFAVVFANPNPDTNPVKSVQLC